MNQQEIWLPILYFNGNDYRGKYEISSLGNLKTLHRGGSRLMKPCIKPDGYATTVLCKDSKKTHVKLHRLVAEHFLPKEEGRTLVNHIDGNKSNNHVSNLEWMSPSENTRHFHSLKIGNARSQSLYLQLENIERKLAYYQAQKEKVLKELQDRNLTSSL